MKMTKRKLSSDEILDVDCRLAEIDEFIFNHGFDVTIVSDDDGFATLYLHDKKCLDRGDYDYDHD